MAECLLDPTFHFMHRWGMLELQKMRETKGKRQSEEAMRRVLETDVQGASIPRGDEKVEERLPMSIL